MSPVAHPAKMTRVHGFMMVIVIIPGTNKKRVPPPWEWRGHGAWKQLKKQFNFGNTRRMCMSNCRCCHCWLIDWREYNMMLFRHCRLRWSRDWGKNNTRCYSSYRHHNLLCIHNIHKWNFRFDVIRVCNPNYMCRTMCILTRCHTHTMFLRMIRQVRHRC